MKYVLVRVCIRHLRVTIQLRNLGCMLYLASLENFRPAVCSSSIALALSQVCSYVHVGQYFVAAEFLGLTTNKSWYVHGV